MDSALERFVSPGMTHEIRVRNHEIGRLKEPHPMSACPAAAAQQETFNHFG